MRAFVREKKIYCGKDYLEVDCFTYTDEQEKAKKGKRSKKEKISTPKQMNLNDKNSKRYLTQLTNTNFGETDYHITATYCNEHLPDSIDKAEKEVINFLRRISYRRKKEGLEPHKYILVTEYSLEEEDEEKPVRIHHHIIISGGLQREVIENLWRKPKKKGQVKGDFLGFVNVDGIKHIGNGAAALCNYITKGKKNKKRWSCSQNLDKPISRTNDHKYSRREIEKIAKNPPDDAFWENKYKGYTLVKDKHAFLAEYNEYTGWAIYLKLKKKEVVNQINHKNLKGVKYA